MGLLKKLFGTRSASLENRQFLRLQEIGKDDIAANDTDRIAMLVGMACTEMKELKQFPLWTLTVAGYDEDSRALFEIPEVRAWCQMIHGKQGSMLTTFLDTSSLRWYLACLFDIEIQGREAGKDFFHHKSLQQVQALAQDTLLRTSTLCVMYGLKAEAIHKIMQATAQRLTDATGLKLASEVN